MAAPPLPPDRSAERAARATRWASFAVAAVLVALLSYLGYVGYEGSRQLTSAPSPATGCSAPSRLGWPYEAVNYDQAVDAALEAGDPLACVRHGDAPAGDEVTAADGIPLAGWYIPSADGAGPTAPTVILAHGWGGSKSSMLARAEILHEAFNLLLFDFRNHGQSGPTETTQGVREADDLRAMVDWLTVHKGPERIAILGVSMGGASALAHAHRDERVDALIVESTHATIANAARARLDVAGYPLSVPGVWAILLGALLRTGEDVTVADPVTSLKLFDGRPLLLLSGGGDTAIGPNDAADLLVAAEEAGSIVELHVCAGAEHGQSPATCPEAYAEWVLGFLERHLATPS